MLTSEFDYILPEELIAQEPLAQRDQARMLVLHKKTGQIEHRIFANLPEYLKPDDLLVMNDTRVTARRLMGHKQNTGVPVEALLLKPLDNSEYEALMKPGRRLKKGAVIEFEGGLTAQVEGYTVAGGRIIRFLGEKAEQQIERIGAVPLPPYIHQQIADPERYQTVYANMAGSAAAPTAGLHFTPRLLEEIRGIGVRIATVTLNVGIDTFRPVKSDRLEDHPMHGEHFRLSQETADAVRECKGRILAVGTTSARALESSAIGKRELEPGECDTKLFIMPGYQFKVVDAMLTNFHLPRTTMLSLVSALAGRDHLFHAYEQAVEQRYRFLSFGDSMLVI